MPTVPDYVVSFRTGCTNQRPFGCPARPGPPPATGPGWHAWGMPRTSSFDGLRQLLDEQLAVASRGQLLALGMNDRAMQYRLRPDGPWQALLPGIYLAVTGTPTFEQKEMAALLYAGPESVVTGPAALVHHGIGIPVPPDVIDVLLPAERQRVDAELRPPAPHRPDAGLGPCWPGRCGWPRRPAPWPTPPGSSPAWTTFRAVVAAALSSGRCTPRRADRRAQPGPDPRLGRVPHGPHRPRRASREPSTASRGATLRVRRSRQRMMAWMRRRVASGDAAAASAHGGRVVGQFDLGADLDHQDVTVVLSQLDQGLVQGVALDPGGARLLPVLQVLHGARHAAQASRRLAFGLGHALAGDPSPNARRSAPAPARRVPR